MKTEKQHVPGTSNETVTPSSLSSARVPRARATPHLWSLVKMDYIAGNGSLRALAARHGVSESTLMKRARREKWHANRTLASHSTDATVVASLAQRAENFVHRSVEQTDRFLARISESAAILEPRDTLALRQVVGAFKDVVAVGRDTYGLKIQDDGQTRCLVNLNFLQNYEPATPELAAFKISSSDGR